MKNNRSIIKNLLLLKIIVTLFSQASANEFSNIKLHLEVGILSSNKEYILTHLNELKSIGEEHINDYINNRDINKSYLLGHLSVNVDLLIADFASSKSKLFYYKKLNKLVVENKYKIKNTIADSSLASGEMERIYSVFDVPLWRLRGGKLILEKNFYSFMKDLEKPEKPKPE